jgi:hypothetical protein
MARPIAPTPVLRGEAAKRFIEASFNPPKLKPAKVLSQKTVNKILAAIRSEQNK